jgi:HEAT repeat protein
MLRSLTLVAVSVVCGVGLNAAYTAPAACPDLDLDVPVGSPIDWDRDLPQPTPNITTGTPGKAIAKADPKPAPKVEKGGGTQIQQAAPPPTPPPMIGFGIPNLYNFFRVKTVDIMTHLQVNIPKKPNVPFEPPAPKAEPPMIDTGTSSKERGGKPEPAPAVTMRSGMAGNYVPPLPGELAWICIATNLRASLHPELVNFAEAKAYLQEIGEANAAYNNPGLMKDKPADIPATPPPFPSMKDKIDQMMSKIAVIELISGYPHAMDPTYAKHTLLVGDLALNAIIECTKSPHTFLQHNAVAVLANAQGQKAAEELRKIVDTANDNETLVRAIMGCARKHDKKAIPSLQKRCQGDEAVSAAAVYALGVIATEDGKVANQLASLAQTANPDMAWTILAAIARIHCTKDKTLTSTMTGLWKGWTQKAGQSPAAALPPAPVPGKGGAAQAPAPEPAGTKIKIISEVALLAAAASGDNDAKREAVAKGVTGFNRQLWVLAAEVLPHLGPEGITAAKSVANHEESNVAVAAVRAIGDFKEEVPFLKQTAGSGKALVRAAALTKLIVQDEEACKEVCKQIVKSGSISPAEEAFLTGMALEMLDRFAANDGADVLSVVNKAKAANAIAKRSATDEYDITKAKIDVFPPCLEIATLSVGRTQYEPAVDVLIGFLNDQANPVRGEAALSLGSFGMASQLKKVGDALLKGLVDPSDGWVRFCCYLALKNLSGKDFSTDYVFGSTSDVWGCAVKYRDWLREVTKDMAPAPAPNDAKPADDKGKDKDKDKK